MGYIKFILSTRKTNADGNATYARISRIESDMADTKHARDEFNNACACGPRGKSN